MMQSRFNKFSGVGLASAPMWVRAHIGRATGVLTLLAGVAAVSLQAAVVVVPADTSWSALTGGSGPGADPGRGN